MKKTIAILLCCAGATLIAPAQNKTPVVPVSDRKIWLGYLDKIAKPVLMNLAQDRLKEKMPVVLSPHVDTSANAKTFRSQVAYLEAFGRVMSGIAPWLNGEGGSPEEVSLRNQYRQWAVQALANAVNPSA